MVNIDTIANIRGTWGILQGYVAQTDVCRTWCLVVWRDIDQGARAHATPVDVNVVDGNV
jgi:hypothetical protein